MYQRLEEEYIKNSKSNNFLKSSFIYFFMLYALTLVINSKILKCIIETRKLEINGIIKLIILAICTGVATITIGGIILTLYILYKKIKNNNTNFKTEFINIIKNISNKRNEDKELIRTFLKKNNYYNNTTIQNIINHYRIKSLTDKKEISFIEILSIVLTLVYKDNGNNILMIKAILIAIIIFTYIKNIKSIILVLTKKEDLYKNLEEILSEIQVELLQDTKNMKLKKGKKKSRG